MLTPAISASSTSDPWVIRTNAFWTQVTSPPFLNLLPLADEMTTGLTPPLGAITAGACDAWEGWVVSARRGRGAAAASPAAAPAIRKSRRFSVSLIVCLRSVRVFRDPHSSAERRAFRRAGLRYALGYVFRRSAKCRRSLSTLGAETAITYGCMGWRAA